ncbi:MAG: hypothetical protein ACLP1E_04870 [Acidimicrobiales bacterium]
MQSRQTPRTGHPPRSGRVAVLGIVVAVLVSSAACTTGQPTAGQPTAGHGDLPIARSASLQSVRALRSVHDVAGEPIPFGTASYFGAVVHEDLGSGVIGIAASSSGRGYLLATGNGRVFNFGDARFHGSIAAGNNAQVVAIVETGNGGGYWLACSTGRLFNFGDAGFYGSAGGLPLTTPIVAMAATPDGRGYWLVASGGRVFHYGNAHFYGSASFTLRRYPIVAAAATPDGKGYWLLPSIPPSPVELPNPGNGFVAGHVTAIGDSVMLDAQPALEADIPGIDVEAAVSRQWDDGIALAQQLRSEDRLGAIVVIDLGTNGPVSLQQFTDMMNVLSGASRVVFVTVHLPSDYTWANSVNATLEQGVPHYPRDRLADFNKLADENPQWFYSDGVHMPIGGAGAQAMAGLVKPEI